MFVCICCQVREREVRDAIRLGARDEDAVGDACGAGTGCGSCRERICDLLREETGADTLAMITR